MSVPTNNLVIGALIFANHTTKMKVSREVFMIKDLESD
jgi:hypothetical protein